MKGSVGMEKGKDQLTLRLPAELKWQLQREADRRGMSLNGLIIILLQASLEAE